MGKLDELVSSYGEHDTELKSIKKVCDNEKDMIKSIMTSDNLETHSSGGYTVKCVTYPKESLNEEILLQILKRDWTRRYGSLECPYIGVREYVDMDKLEAVIYNGELPVEVLEEMNKAKETTMVTKLTCVKSKKKED